MSRYIKQSIKQAINQAIDHSEGIEMNQVESQSQSQSQSQLAQGAHEYPSDESNGPRMRGAIQNALLRACLHINSIKEEFQMRMRDLIIDERGDVPGWVLVVLMTTGLVTGIWTVAAPRIESLLRGSLDSMNSVR